MGGSSLDTSSSSLSARRFAVVVTNGSVAKYSLDKEQSVGLSASTKATSTTPGVNQTQNKPAMGRYWHVSDVGIWLEEDKSATQYQQHQQPINFHDDTSVVGLALAEKKVVCASLQNHYGKSRRSRGDRSGGQMNDKPIAKFRIRGGGIDDLES